MKSEQFEYKVEEIYNCRNKDANGHLILLREPGKETTNTEWIEWVLGIRECQKEQRSAGRVSFYHNRFEEWIKPLSERELEKIWFANFSNVSFGEGYRNKKSEEYKKLISKEKKIIDNSNTGETSRTKEILDNISEKGHSEITIYTVYDIYDIICKCKFIERETDNDGKGYYFNKNQSERKRHCIFKYNGCVFEMYEILHPVASGAKRYIPNSNNKC